MPSAQPDDLIESNAQPEPVLASSSRSAGKQPRKLKPLIFIAVIILLVIVAVGSYFLFFRKTSYQAVTNQFIAAMQRGDKAKVDSLTSPQEKAQLKKYENTSSYYTFCQHTGILCKYYYNSKFINKATVTSQDFKSPFSGKMGKQVLYNLKGSASGNSLATKKCNNPGSNTSLVIYLEPHGKTWLVDGANPFTSYSC